MAEGTQSQSRAGVQGGSADLLRLLEENPSLDPALRESLMMSLQAHQEQTQGEPIRAPRGPEPPAAAAAVEAMEPVEPVEVADPVVAEERPPEPSAARPLSRKEQVARYPLHFRLRMLKLPLMVLGGAFLGVILFGALLLSSYWKGLESGIGQPAGLLVWYAALTVTTYLGARILDRKVSFPEGVRFVCQLQTLLLPMAGLAVGWVLTLDRNTGLVLAALLAGATWYCHRRVEQWIMPSGGSWYSRYGLLAVGCVVAAPFLAFSPAWAAMLGTGVFLVGERSLRKVPRIDLEPWHTHVLPYSLLAGPFVCAWSAVGFSGRTGGEALAPLLVVAVNAALYLQYRVVPTLSPKVAYGVPGRRLQWGMFSLGGLALAVSLVDRDSLVFAAAGASWLAFLASRALGQPLLLLPALLGSVLGHGALARRVTDFWPQPDPGLFMTLAFLPYVVALAFLWTALERRRHVTESLMGASWFLLVTVSLVAATWLMGTPLHMGFTLAGVGLAVFAAGTLMTRPLLAFLGTVSMTAAAGLTLDTLRHPVSLQVTVLSLTGVGLFLASAVMGASGRPRIRGLGRPVQGAALILAPTLVAVGLLWGERPFLAGVAAPVPALVALSLLWCCAAVSLRRADVALAATALAAWTGHVALAGQGFGLASFWQVPAAGALALMPWALEELSRVRRFARAAWPAPLRFRHGAPLSMLALQAPLVFAWPTLTSSLTVMEMAAGCAGWVLLSLALVGSGLRSGLRWPVCFAALPFAAAAALPTWPMGLEVCGAVAGGALLVGGGLAFVLLRRQDGEDQWTPDEVFQEAVDQDDEDPDASVWTDAERRDASAPILPEDWNGSASIEAQDPSDPMDAEALRDLAELAGAGGGDDPDWMPFEEEPDRPGIHPRSRRP